MNKPHKKLTAWSTAVDLVIAIHEITTDFPGTERYGLTDQMRRAALSIPSNIAEGAARQTEKEFLHFLHIAKGSLSELDTHLEIAPRLSFLSDKQWADLNAQLEHLDRMLSGLMRHRRSTSRS
ncbi:MAG: four helix bundle protein [Nitrospira sp.]|nr:four helix bundle protein [Nitrospira sp.]